MIQLEDLRLTPSDGMLLRTELKMDPLLSGLEIIRQPQQTVCSVDVDRERALLERWNAEQRGRTEPS